MSFPNYPKYKDSGVEWLGEVPAEWRIQPFWAHFRRSKRTGYPQEELLSVYREYGVIRKTDRNDNHNNPSEDLTAYQLVEPDDLVINKMKAWQGSVAISPYHGIVSPAYFVYRPLHLESSQFLHYLMRSPRYITGYLSLSKGVRIGQWDLDPIYHSRLPLLLPSAEEQQAISHFLDQETAKIDALIAEQQRLIELLEEKRQAVISHAVTKGLTSSTLSEWQAVSLRYFARLHRGYDLTADEQTEGPYPVVTSGGITGAHSEFTCKAPGVVTGRYGSTGRLFYIDVDYWPHNTTLFVCDFFGNDEKFVWYALQSLDLESHSAKAAVPGIDRNDLHPIPMRRPPLQEQKEIVTFLDSRMTQFTRLQKEAFHIVQVLQERRSALISAAVTGKIDVRGMLRKPVQSTWQSGFARQVLAAEALRQCNGPTMGRIKLQKLIHLCEYHAQLDEIAGNYSRKAAGPFDSKVMAGVRNGLKQQKWFEEYKDGGRYAYRPMEKAGAHKPYLAHWADKKAKIDQILSLLRTASTRTCEIASTLYAAWNDLLLEGKAPSDDEIIHEASSAERWHESKEKIAPEKWPKALAWMRANALVPVGYGAHTKLADSSNTEEDNEPA